MAKTLTMSLKERIIRSKIARLAPWREAPPIRLLEAELAQPVAQAPPAGITREVTDAPLEPGPRRPLTEADVEPLGHPLTAPFSKHAGDTLSEEPTAKAVGSSRRVADFRALNAEVHIRFCIWGDIYLVPGRTAAPRFEILPEEVRMLSLAGDAFDAKVVEVKRNVPA